MSDNDSIAKVCENIKFVFSNNPGYLEVLDENPDGPLRKLILSILNESRHSDIDLPDSQSRALIAILHVVNSACMTDHTEKGSDGSVYLTALARTLRNMFNQIDSTSRYDKGFVIHASNRNLSMAMAACMLIIETIPLSESQKKSIQMIKDIFRMLDGTLDPDITAAQDSNIDMSLDFLRTHYYNITSNAQFAGYSPVSVNLAKLTASTIRELIGRGVIVRRHLCKINLKALEGNIKL